MYIGSSSVLLDCLKSTTVSLALLLCSISLLMGHQAIRLYTFSLSAVLLLMEIRPVTVCRPQT